MILLKLGSLDGSAVNNPLAIQGKVVWSLGQEDALQKKMVTHYSILAKKIPWTGETGQLYSMGTKMSQTWLSK